MKLVPPLCECGKPATGVCFDLYYQPKLVPCRALICESICKAHRHQIGTMGYVDWTATGKFNGFQPEKSGFVEWLRCRWRDFFWSARKKAEYAWAEVQRASPPPAPLPGFLYQVGARTFTVDVVDGQLKEI